ncbi:MAG: response regulator transcription factor [Fibromonadaceae bacterium]|jgi:DNA-binding response OmpR family regulator|nr:response regulator transcription factor [Fibromonadaceae bacterium]
MEHAQKKKILVVDDDRDICEILSFNLKHEGYEVDAVHSAEEALKKLSPEHCLILLDVMMGGMSGYQMAEKLRKDGNNINIIFLTAKDTENDMLTGFSVGADDYISKPFSLKEVSARVKAVLKRQIENAKEAEIALLTIDDLQINFQSKEAKIKNEVIPLTKTEFEILALLAQNPTRVYSRQNIISQVWKDTIYITERTVDVHITRLRKKLGAKGSLISSRAGFGYKFNEL